MTDYTIPCETYARLSKMQENHPSDDPWCDSIRLEDNYAIATNRYYLIVERLDPTVVSRPALHIKIDPALLAVAQSEAPLHGKIHIAAVDVLKHASAKTTFGYSHPDNIGLYLDDPNDLDRWRSIIPTEEPIVGAGSMGLNVESIATLVSTSPSGKVTFPEIIDWTQPVIVNDAVDPNWFAVFYVREHTNLHTAARLPRWFK